MLLQCENYIVKLPLLDLLSYFFSQKNRNVKPPSTYTDPKLVELLSAVKFDFVAPAKLNKRLEKMTKS